jgi:hypothetical protein
MGNAFSDIVVEKYEIKLAEKKTQLIIVIGCVFQ